MTIDCPGTMRTSVLERGWPQLADAVTWRTDAQRTLGELVRVNAFVQQQQGNPLSYRYHPVLRAVLQAELNNSSNVDVADLQRIGAEWLNAHGHYDEALRLAVKSGDWSTASSLIVSNLGIARLLTWPNGCSLAKVFHLASRTRFNLQTSVVCAGLALAACDTNAAALCLSQARAGIQERAPTAGAATDLSIAVDQVALAHACGKWPDVLVWAKEAEAMLASQSPNYQDGLSELRAVILWHKGAALLWAGDLTAAAAHLRTGAAVADRIHATPVRMNCLGQLALLETLTGNPGRAAELATTVTRLAEQFSVPAQFLPAAAEVAFAWVSAQYSDLVAARSHADRATDSRSVCSDPLSAALLTVVKARLRAGRKEATTATEAGVNSDFDGPNVRLPQWLASRLTVAASRLGQQSVANRVDVPPLPNGDRARPLTMVLAHATARYPHLEVAGRDRERRNAEAKALAAGTPGAAAVGHPPSEGLAVSSAPFIQPLTDREMEVLEKLAAYFSTEEIAQCMFISVNTVRTHVRSILRKLSANRRNEALRRARQLQMIP